MTLGVFHRGLATARGGMTQKHSSLSPEGLGSVRPTNLAFLDDTRAVIMHQGRGSNTVDLGYRDRRAVNPEIPLVCRRRDLCN